MKAKTVKNKFKAQRAVSCVLAVQLALSLSPLAAFAESESLTNNTLPMAQPAPSQFVQKIWGSLDIRKLAKKKDAAAASNSKGSLELVEKKPLSDAQNANVKETAEAKDASKPGDETESTASGVTSTGQMVFSTKQAETEKNAAAAVQTEAASAPVVSSQTNASQTEVPAAPKTDETAKTETASTPAPAATETPAAATETASAPVFSAKSSDKPIEIANALIALPPGSVLGRMQVQSDALVVDNDEVEEVEETIKQEEIATDEGKTRAKAGARFPVVISSGLSSKTAKKGEPITARLKYDLKIGDKLIAKKGAVVNGHINYSLKARTILHSLVSPERWYRNSGCIGLSFDEIINEKGEHLPLVAVPARQARIVKNKAEGRELGVNQYGQVTGPWAQQLRYKALRIGLNAALAPAGVFSFGAMPVALGVLGAANPSFAFSKPVGLNVRHRRLKGFAWGFLSGIPGSWLIEDTTVKGQEAIIKPGDEFYAEFVQEFTGEPASDAQLMPNAATKIRGEILNAPKGKKDKAAAGSKKK